MSSLQWVDKYKPVKIEDIIGNKKPIQEIYNWLKVFTKEKKPGSNFKNSILISGPPGIGKTSTAHIILKEFGFNVIEFNASELRTSKILSEKIITILSGKSVQMMFNKNIRTAIILDEIDGIESKKECSSTDIAEYINYSYLQKCKKIKGKNKSALKKQLLKNCINNNPIICICNYTGKSVQSLLKEVIHIKFNSPSDNDILNILTKINTNEQLNINNAILNLLVPHCQNDMRRSIYILEYISGFIKKDHNISNKKVLDIINNLGHKDMDIGLYEAIHTIFFTYDSSMETLLNSYNADTNFVPFIIHENFINFIDKNTQGSYSDKLDECIRYYEYLTYSQMFKNHLFGMWFITEYIGFLSCYYPNFIIKNSNLKNTPKDTNIQKSALISKYNYRYYNLKSINFLCKKLSIDIDNFHIFASLLIHSVFSSEKTLSRYIDFLNKRRFTFKEFEKILKLSPYFDKYSKKWTKKYQKDLLSMFNEN